MAYVNDGYWLSGYCKGDTRIAVMPTDTIARIKRSFILDGVDISKFVDSFFMNKLLNRLYHTAELTLNNYELDYTLVKNKNKLLNVKIENDEYNFIIIDVETSSRKENILILKTQGCLLEKPFSQEKTEQFIDIRSSSIIKKLTKNISTNNNIPSFFTNGRFLRESLTDGETLESILSITKSDFYEKENALFLSERFRIYSEESPKFEFEDKFIISKKFSNNSDGDRDLKTIFLNLEDYQQDLKIGINKDANCQRPSFLFCPLLITTHELTANLGTFSISEVSLTQTTLIVLDDIVKVEWGILRIERILRDGDIYPSSNYGFQPRSNVINFTEKVYGNFTIIYYSNTVSNYSQNGNTVAINTRSYNLSYYGEEFNEVVRCDLDLSTIGEIQKCYLDCPSKVGEGRSLTIIAKQNSIEAIRFVGLNPPDDYTYDSEVEGIKFQSRVVNSNYLNGTKVTNSTETIPLRYTIVDLNPFAEVFNILDSGDYRDFYFWGFATGIGELLTDELGILETYTRIRTQGVTYYYQYSKNSNLAMKIGEIIECSVVMDISEIYIPNYRAFYNHLNYNPETRTVTSVSKKYLTSVKTIFIDGCEPKKIEVMKTSLIHLRDGGRSNADETVAPSSKGDCITIPQSSFVVKIAEVLRVSNRTARNKDVILDGKTLRTNSSGNLTISLSAIRRKYVIDTTTIEEGTRVVVDCSSAEVSK